MLYQPPSPSPLCHLLVSAGSTTSGRGILMGSPCFCTGPFFGLGALNLFGMGAHGVRAAECVQEGRALSAETWPHIDPSGRSRGPLGCFLAKEKVLTGLEVLTIVCARYLLGKGRNYVNVGIGPHK